MEDVNNLTIFPESIKSVFPKEFPDNYFNDIDGWGFSQEIIKENKGRLLTLDIDFGEKPICSLNCPTCFQAQNQHYSLGNKENHFEKKEYRKSKLSYEKFKKTILEAKKLGLKSIKFLGGGDMFESSYTSTDEKKIDILDFLKLLKEEGIAPLIFTKGQIIGDDTEVKKRFGDKGIDTSRKMIQELYNLDCRIMLGINGINKKTYLREIGFGRNPLKIFRKDLEQKKREEQWEKVKQKQINSVRNTINLLVHTGFNDYKKHPTTRMAICTNPVNKQNYSEVFDIYKWARRRHMYCVVTPSMESGRGTPSSAPPQKQLIELYLKIYKWNIKNNLQTASQIEQEKISAYAGGHPCNQLSAGLYLNADGEFLRCPGNQGKDWVEGNVIEQSLEEIWNNSRNKLEFEGEFNNGCPAKKGTLTPQFFNEVYNRMK